MKKLFPKPPKPTVTVEKPKPVAAGSHCQIGHCHIGHCQISHCQ